MGKLLKLGGDCSGGTCPAVYEADEAGMAAVQARRAPRSIRRRMDGWSRGEVAGFIPEDAILAAADQIRARRAQRAG